MPAVHNTHPDWSPALLRVCSYILLKVVTKEAELQMHAQQPQMLTENQVLMKTTHDNHVNGLPLFRITSMISFCHLMKNQITKVKVKKKKELIVLTASLNKQSYIYQCDTSVNPQTNMHLGALSAAQGPTQTLPPGGRKQWLLSHSAPPICCDLTSTSLLTITPPPLNGACDDRLTGEWRL